MFVKLHPIGPVIPPDPISIRVGVTKSEKLLLEIESTKTLGVGGAPVVSPTTKFEKEQLVIVPTVVPILTILFPWMVKLEKFEFDKKKGGDGLMLKANPPDSKTNPSTVMF